MTLTLLLDYVWSGLVAAGIAAAVLPWLDRRSVPARTFVNAVAIALILRYIAWRWTGSIPPFEQTVDFVAGVGFAFAESLAALGTVISLVFLSRTRDRSPEVDTLLAAQDNGAPKPPVDVLICTYNEEEAILERTIIGATGLDYPDARVWVCDDGRRPWLEALATRLGAGYITRSDNRHAKAGNINHALGAIAGIGRRPEFVVVLDADFVVAPAFVTRTLPLMTDPSVAVVQTPQHFFNPDPIQSNLSSADVWPDEQRYFFDNVLASRDAWDGAFCCGTSSLIRFDALEQVGGFPTESVTEDYLLTLKLKEIGFRTVYLNERLSLGLAPEGLKEFMTQRGRWCLGAMQIIRGPSGILSRSPGIGITDRLLLVDTLLNWLATHAFRVLGLVVPLLYLLAGIRAVYANVEDTLYHFLPYFAWQSAAMAWIARGRVMPVMSDVIQAIAAPTILKACATGLLRPRGHKFKVTAKGGDRRSQFMEWSVLRLFLPLAALTVAGILVGTSPEAESTQHDATLLAVGWCWYNLIVLLIASFICIEQPRYRRNERFRTNEPVTVAANGTAFACRARDLSTTGMGIRGDSPFPIGTSVVVTIDGSDYRGRIIRQKDHYFAVVFADTLANRIRMTRRLFSGRYGPANDEFRPSAVTRSVFSRIFR